MFLASDIKWVKNVKRDNGTGWAYFEPGMEQTFDLNFSDSQRKGAKSIKPGEVVLLFQRIDNIPGVNKQTYLTHLVTPTDDILRNDPNLGHRFQWLRSVAVIARAEPRTAIFTTPNKLSFYKPQYGKITDVSRLNDEKPRTVIQNEVWRHFERYMLTDLDHIVVSQNQSEEYDQSVLEGGEVEVLRRHIIRERNWIIVGLAKSRALSKGNGRIECECCDFDFMTTYGDHGYSFIECHHALPISTGGERYTRVEDLHLVCSNCHRMLHRKNGKNHFYNISELRNLIAQNKV